MRCRKIRKKVKTAKKKITCIADGPAESHGFRDGKTSGEQKRVLSPRVPRFNGEAAGGRGKIEGNCARKTKRKGWVRGSPKAPDI